MNILDCDIKFFYFFKELSIVKNIKLIFLYKIFLIIFKMLV